MGKLERNIALVTGAGSGFGAAIAEKFAAEGAVVLVGDINQTSGEAVAVKLHGATFVKLDVTSHADWKAALPLAKPSVDVTDDEFDTLLNVNIKSVYLSVSEIMPYFVGRGSGASVNTSYMDRITQGLASEYDTKGVRINPVCPLRAPTGLLEKFSGVLDTPEKRERFGKSVPLGRMTEPMDVAKVVAFPASDEKSGFITGVW
ncbi:putative alcohol dehydrogenase [Tricharina praecox]|uniref:putative alcohol dehydrogenase n=1 Tax=Tricharina praecox TaxID=43433 RepID=UPI00221F5948|nr:putative alcohol dehydrogenase [Tricharina praecox]KAI5845408.1 putative alcohol dehydrogenase [Tricharina praecox]